jgi:predicted transposase YbfD/YdcC
MKKSHGPMRSSAPSPSLDAIDIEGKDVTADALLTQRDIARYLVGRNAHYHFTVKGNQPGLLRGYRALLHRPKRTGLH